MGENIKVNRAFEEDRLRGADERPKYLRSVAVDKMLGSLKASKPHKLGIVTV